MRPNRCEPRRDLQGHWRLRRCLGDYTSEPGTAPVEAVEAVADAVAAVAAVADRGRTPAVPCPGAAGPADLRARRGRRRLAAGPRPPRGFAPRAVPQDNRRADPRRAAGSGRRRSRPGSGAPPPTTSVSPGAGGRRRSWTRAGVRRSPAGGSAASSTTPGRRWTRRVARDPGRPRARLGGRGRHGPAAHQPRAGGGVELAVRRLHAHGVKPGDRVGILLPMLVETVVAVLALGRLRAIYTPIFSGYGAPAIAARLADCGGVRPDHRRRLPAAGRLGRAQGGGRCRRRGGAVGSPGARRAAGGRCRWRRRGRTAATPGGTRRCRARTTGPPRTTARPPTRRRRTWSSTRREPPAGRRARSTSMAGSRSRARRTSPTSSTWGAATPCSGSPTSAG